MDAGCWEDVSGDGMVKHCVRRLEVMLGWGDGVLR